MKPSDVSLCGTLPIGSHRDTWVNLEDLIGRHCQIFSTVVPPKKWVSLQTTSTTCIMTNSMKLKQTLYSYELVLKILVNPIQSP